MTIHPPTEKPKSDCSDILLYVSLLGRPKTVIPRLGFYVSEHGQFYTRPYGCATNHVVGWCYVPKFDPAKVGVEQ